ncbi:hypothetical protein [Desulfobacula sp.]|uniref:hypothetical protein n=1 Tax=Desulfobacula sp. TaxID=2593537 RepID=UPI002634CA3C|nr:hypothetical protein [Desulfobacula sp.]
MPLTKTDIVERITEKIDLKPTEAKEALEELLEAHILFGFHKKDFQKESWARCYRWFMK